MKAGPSMKSETGKRTMATSEDSSFRQEHWVRWLETTCDYLFAEQDRPLAAAPTASRGARERFLYRARGKLLLLLKTRPPGELDALDELERTFTMQASFVARHPDVSRRLLGWLLEGSDRSVAASTPSLASSRRGCAASSIGHNGRGSCARRSSPRQPRRSWSG